MSHEQISAPRLGIAAVEQETGLSKHALRAWERRYGFPKPSRAANGERLYPEWQVAKLKLVMALVMRGHRPGKIIALPAKRLERLAAAAQGAQDRPGSLNIVAFLDQISAGSLIGLHRALQANLVRHGLRRFVLETVQPLMRQVGEEWACGRMKIFHEHLVTEQVDRTLRQAMAALVASDPPAILLSTFPGERHSMGLLMLEALLTLEGATCIPLGVQTPMAQIAKLAANAKVDIVALSFSAACRDQAFREKLEILRRDLDPRTVIWCGGEGARGIGRIRGVRVMRALEDAVEALHVWRQTH